MGVWSSSAAAGATSRSDVLFQAFPRGNSYSTTRLQVRPTNIASVHLVMGCPNTREGVKIVKKTLRAT